jgi:ribosomal-protein-alanine N-acetyltransferase
VTHALSTSRLELELLSAAHAEALVEPFQDARVWTYLPQLRPADREAVRERFRRWLAPPPAEMPEAIAFENWVGFERTTRAIVGTFQATIVRDGSATIGYIVFPDHQRRGYAVEAMTAVCTHLRAAHSIRRVVADMDRRNEASAAVAQRLGMVEASAAIVGDRSFVWPAPRKATT